MLLRNSKTGDLRKNRGRLGVATVEFALLSPILAALIMGLLELGRALTVKVALCNASCMGCQTGIKKGKSNSDIVNEAIAMMRLNGLDATQFNPPSLGSVTVSATDPSGNPVPDVLNAPADSSISVQVAIPVSSTMWVTPFFISASASQSKTVVMKKQ